MIPRVPFPILVLAVLAAVLSTSSSTFAQPAVPLDDLSAPPQTAASKSSTSSTQSTASAPEFIIAGGARLRSGWAVAMEPGGTVEFTISGGGHPDTFLADFENEASIETTETAHWTFSGGRLRPMSSGAYRVQLPATPGNHVMRFGFTRQRKVGAAFDADKFEATLTFLLRAPFDRNGNGSIDGYPIGIYPNENAQDAPGTVAAHPENYLPPKSFILVTPEVEPLALSPHYHLRDFIPRAEAGRKHWIALDPRLLEFLEAATEELQTQRGQAKSHCPLKPLLAFLSPNHLAQLRAKSVNFALYSRYQYGDGATVVWDADGDGRMDDLNKDGNIDVTDAQELADKLAEFQKRIGKFGGIGAAGNSKMPGVADTPVVDLDMRGVASRW